MDASFVLRMVHLSPCKYLRGGVGAVLWPHLTHTIMTNAYLTPERKGRFLIFITDPFIDIAVLFFLACDSGFSFSF